MVIIYLIGNVCLFESPAQSLTLCCVNIKKNRKWPTRDPPLSNSAERKFVCLHDNLQVEVQYWLKIANRIFDTIEVYVFVEFPTMPFPFFLYTAKSLQSGHHWYQNSPLVVATGGSHWWGRLVVATGGGDWW